jgi:Protein of unknown function (DUF339).
MERNLKVKRIKFLASRRSSSEMEILLGRFLESLDLESLEDKELDRILSLLSLLDTELKDYVYGLRDVPKDFEDLVLKLRNLNQP